jgi:hypothetical protein
VVGGRRRRAGAGGAALGHGGGSLEKRGTGTLVPRSRRDLDGKHRGKMANLMVGILAAGAERVGRATVEGGRRRFEYAGELELAQTVQERGG